MFPGLIYRMKSEVDAASTSKKDRNVVLLIFTSGKIVITGGRSREEVYAAFKKIYPVLFNFKKKQSAQLQSSIAKTKRQLLMLKDKE